MKASHYLFHPTPIVLLWAWAFLGVEVGQPTALGAPVQASKGQITLPTYPWLPAVRHPYFRETDGKNIYPYPMLDNLSRDKTNQVYRTVVLENEHLRITFLPELGGKIHEVIDKTTSQPMFYVNHVIKPGLIGMCGAWTSGGVEWNTGPQGHTVSAMLPVDVVILPLAQDGSRSVAIGETERIYGTKWTVTVTLRPGRSFIEERIRIYNPTEYVRPYYFWNCTASANTPGFRFIYPMTLGTDHGSEKFFDWPIDHGKDLTRGTNYQDASSIFAWHCDQDFFGSYDDGAERGVVAYANHHEVPGKKAWTWGQGGFGKMHQMDLTDKDGPYNEVQTGPLLTQGEVGRLEPCEAIEWQEWWYPIHGLGGFTYANRDLAVNASRDGDQLTLRVIGTGTWRKLTVHVRGDSRDFRVSADCSVSPLQSSEVRLPLPAGMDKPEVEFVQDEKSLARFRVPLDLPVRTKPAPKPARATAAEWAQAGWDHYLFARMPDAESAFQNALKKDPNSEVAHTGLAMLSLSRDSAEAQTHAEAALATNPDAGLARFLLALALLPKDEAAALDHAWKASLNPAAAVAGRTLAARILIGRQQYQEAIAALAARGPWQNDSLCRNRRAYAHLMAGETDTGIRLARESLAADPIDTFALSLFWLAKRKPEAGRLDEMLSGQAEAVLDLAEKYLDLNDHKTALRLIDHFYARRVPSPSHEPLVVYWIQYLRDRLQGEKSVVPGPPSCSTPSVLPCSAASGVVLEHAVKKNPQDGCAALLLGHFLFHQGRHAQARLFWKSAAELGASPVVAYRSLGMASLALDQDPAAAAGELTQAHQADPKDAIVARDLARVLFALAGKSDNGDEKKALWSKTRDTLLASFNEGKGRADFVCLLGRAQNRLGQHEETAKLLDSVRITVWEGSHEAHDLFVEAHLDLGRAHLAAGRAAEALKEFDRALEYPENLATGKLENAKEGPIHKLRADALAALGKDAEARQARELAR